MGIINHGKVLDIDTVCVCLFVCLFVGKTTFHLRPQKLTPSSGGTTDINRLSLGRSIFYQMMLCDIFYCFEFLSFSLFFHSRGGVDFNFPLMKIIRLTGRRIKTTSTCPTQRNR
jgi:hypothetical protein